MLVAGIPAYNEEKTIAKVILLAQKHVDTIVVCDDGSQDLTAEIAQRLGAIVIRHKRNSGYGAAIQAIFEKAKALNADLLLTLDADGQHDAVDIPNLVHPILEGKADIVIGSRFLKQNNGVPFHRRLGIKVLTKMTNSSAGKNGITDSQCGFRAYNRKTIEGLVLTEKGMGVGSEILRKARGLGLVVTEVPVEVHYHGLETSTHNPFKHGLSVVSSIIRMIVEESPLVYLGGPGIVSLLVALGFGVYTLDRYAVEGYISTSLALATIAFGLAGAFAIFTAITLYAIARLARRMARE